MKFITEDLKLAVKKGAYWLDENHPNWANSLNLEKLQMNNCGYCVIGQAVGHYFDTIAEAAGSEAEDEDLNEDTWAAKHGFQAPEGVDYRECIEYYAGLETVWSDAIRSRLG